MIMLKKSASSKRILKCAGCYYLSNVSKPTCEYNYCATNNVNEFVEHVHSSRPFKVNGITLYTHKLTGIRLIHQSKKESQYPSLCHQFV
jgi:hypothetical protein